MKILILGVAGFIGSNLVERILNTKPDWVITGIDISSKKISDFLDHKNFVYKKIDVLSQTDIIEKLIEENDIILPLVAIANPSIYVTDPLRKDMKWKTRA